MTCGLSEEELFVLNLLYCNRNLSRGRGYHSKKLDGLFQRKFARGSKKAVKTLLNHGYIAPVGKSPEKYYISDIPGAFAALAAHGYHVIGGRERPI